MTRQYSAPRKTIGHPSGRNRRWRFSRSSEFDLATSELARSELLRTPDPVRRHSLLSRLDAVRIFSITADVTALAHEYVSNDIIPAAYEDDAIHVAAAVISSLDALVSWNFRHLVNRRRRALINLLNVSGGLPTLEILTPTEL